VFDRLAKWFLVANGEIVTLLADQDLADGLAADRGFDRILHVADVNTKTIGSGAVDRQIDVRLSADLESAKIGNAGNLAHNILHFGRFLLQRLEIAAKEFDGEFTLNAADGFLHVVGDRLREIPVNAGNLAEGLIHGVDQLFFRVELDAPLGPGQEVDEEFCVVETARIAAVVGPADLTDDLLHFWKLRENGA